MERVNITIGRLTFDYADYDAENDVLYLHIGEPQAGEGEETPEGHIIRYAPDTSQVVGLDGARRSTNPERDGRLGITVPGWSRRPPRISHRRLRWFDDRRV